MNTRNQRFLERLKATFRVEAREHLDVMAGGVAEIEGGAVPARQRELIETVCRAAHSLKGASRAVDMADIETACHALETILGKWRPLEAAPPAEQLALARRELDDIERSLTATPAPAAVPVPPPDRADATRPAAAAGDREGASALAPPAAAPAAERTTAPRAAPAAPLLTTLGDMVRIQVSKLDARMNESDEMLSAKLISQRQAGALREVTQLFEQGRGDWAKIELWALEQGAAPGMNDLLKAQRDRYTAAGAALATLTQAAQQDARTIGKLVDNLLQGSRSLLLMPFSTLSAGYPGMVADLCRDLGKRAAINIHGELVELDKRILDELKDPLLHLLRNCLDHGIEAPDERTRKGKPAQGTVSVSASHGDAGKVEIIVSDDGGGIDAAAVRAAAVGHGLLSEEEAARLTEAESRELVFRSAISTRAVVTRLSGRGLGLAIVREKVEKLGGRVTVDSVAGAGTTFRMLLPVLMAAVRGVLVEVCGRRFVVPSAHVERVARVAPGEVKTVEGRESIAIAGKPLMLTRLGDLLDISATAPPAAARYLNVLVLAFGGQRIACVVDAVLGEQEVLVKPLKKPLLRVRNISGATVLASGKLAPVLNVPDLLRSTRTARRRAAAAAPQASSKKTILVAEDSITSRMLIAGILEAAGYGVSTAVDGIDAITQLRAGKFDLLVSDVDMPRLDGFGLAATVRADKRLEDLPIVLVTARETKEDRERGVDAGANAYIVKRSLEQSGLLEAVRRLL